MQNTIYFSQDFLNSDAVIIFAKSSKFISCTESCTRKAICPNPTALSVFSLSSSNNITSAGRIFKCSLLYSLRLCDFCISVEYKIKRKFTFLRQIQNIFHLMLSKFQHFHSCYALVKNTDFFHRTHVNFARHP